MSSYRWASILAVAVALSGPASSGATAGQSGVTGAEPTGAPLDAIWQIQEFDFHIRTLQRYHSCSSLHQKISGILEAVDTSRFFRFKDNVVVRIRPVGENDGSIVDMRSISRVGVSDIGVNAERVRRFLADLRRG